jgi:hypothetical protein
MFFKQSKTASAMKPSHPPNFLGLSLVAAIALVWPQWAGAFEGKIAAELIRGTETNALLYTVGTNHLRIEVTGSTWPHPVNIVDLKSGAVTLVFPHNRSFVRLRSGGAHAPSRVPADAPSAGVSREARQTAPEAGALPVPSGIGPQAGAPGAPSLPNLPSRPVGLPPGIGPQSGIAAGTQFSNPPAVLPSGPAIGNLPLPPGGLPPGIGPQPAGGGAVPAMPAMAMPMPMIAMPGEKLELQATTNTMNILGFPCIRYDVKQRGETLEVWATDKLFAYRAWLRNQPSRFGPRMLEDQWPALLESHKLFPLRAIVRFDHGAERFRFEVKSVTPEKITDEKLFQPPADYHEFEPLPF